MSSHHIVKDNQEPALLILSADDTLKNILEQLLEWSPQVAVSANALYFCLELGIKIDLIFKTPHEEFDEIALKNRYKQIKIIECHKIIEDAIGYFRNKNQSNINIIGDSMLDLDDTFDKNGIVFYTNNSKSYWIKGVFEKWFAKDIIIITDAKAIHSDNIFKISENQFKVEKQGIIKIFSNDYILLTEKY